MDRAADYRLLVSGQKVDHLRNARSEASRASKLISRALGHTVPVTPALVFVETSEITIRSRPKDVLILTERNLVRALNRLPARINADQAIAIEDVAELPYAWSTKPSVPALHSHLDDFAALVRLENSSLRARLLWLCGIGAVVFFVGVPFAMSVLSAALLSFARQTSSPDIRRIARTVHLLLALSGSDVR